MAQVFADKKVLLKSSPKFMNLREDVLIIYDDDDLPFGSVRLVAKGGHGGHNGISDILNRVHAKNIPRLRVGTYPDYT